MTPLDSLPTIGAPATRALATVGDTSLQDLAGAARSDLATLHRMGPRALRVPEEELGRHGLRLR